MIHLKIKSPELYNIASLVSKIYPNENIIKIDKIGGMTNINYYCQTDLKDMVVRIPGDNTEVMINREFEKHNCQLATKININPNLYHYDLTSGIKITEFIVDSETLKPTTINSEKVLKKVAGTLRHLHSSNLKFINVFNVFEQYRNYITTLSSTETSYNDFLETEKFFLFLESELNSQTIHLAPCHNDPVPENFLLKNNSIYLIDWEYSGMNDPLWDLAALLEESNLSMENESVFLNFYFDRNETSDEKKRILIYRICQNFLWSVWTLIKEKDRNLFGEYGKSRYEKCIKQIKTYKDSYNYE